MKTNIHILPTDKPSRLFYDISLDKIILASTAEVSKWFDNKHIYITSDEEIKVNDTIVFGNIELKKEWNWGFKKIDTQNEADQYNFMAKTTVGVNKNLIFKKIILATDQDLIKDGVQAIDDEFLEWFVKNPSCEEVKWNAYPISSNGNVIGTDKPYPFDSLISNFKIEYKIIIPKEEPKQYPIGGYAPGFYGCTCVTCKIEFMGDKRAVQCESCATKMMNKEEPKQETLEEYINEVTKKFGG